MFRKPVKSKNLRQKALDLKESQEREEDWRDALPKQRSSKPKKVTLSFDEEQEPLEEIQKPIKKLSRATVNHDLIPDVDTQPLMHPSVGYSQDVLEQLKTQSKRPEKGNDKAFAIPDAAAIYEAKKLREQKRSVQKQVAKQSTDMQVDYIPIKETKYESRLVTEDQEVEGLEAFEDNQDTQIHFGATTLMEANVKRKQEFQDNLNQVQVVSSAFIS